MKHYFTNDQDTKSNESEFKVTILDKNFKFITDNGIFSKGELDEASRLLIETFNKLQLTGTLLDVGCGYGAIGLTLAANRADEVHMTDINLRALSLTKRNAILNNLNNVTIYESFCYDKVTQRFAHILSNPPIRAGKKIVHQIITESINHLTDAGTLTIVIGKQHGAASAAKKMTEIFGNAKRIERKKGFWILQSVKVDEKEA